MDMREKVFEHTSYGKAALYKLGEVPENFRIYACGWLGNGQQFEVMQVLGAEFREAKSGKNKGKMCIMVEGTQRETWVTKAEMSNYD